MFESKEEFAKAMLDGREFQYTDDIGHIWFYARVGSTNNTIKFMWARDGMEMQEIHDYWAFYDKVTEIIPWYERIPEQGALCWVWNYKKENASLNVVIYCMRDEKFRPYKTRDSNWWNYAKPLTLNEAKQLVVGE